jgi:hypothetical protein
MTIMIHFRLRDLVLSFISVVPIPIIQFWSKLNTFLEKFSLFSPRMSLPLVKFRHNLTCKYDKYFAFAFVNIIFRYQ